QGVAQLVPIEGREVAEAGDIATVDSEGFVEGAPIKGARREGGNVEVAPGSLLDGKCEALIGAHIGETREQAVTFPADWGMADLRGKEAVFKVALRGLKKREVPALDDAFAQDLGTDAKTLPELKQKIRDDLAGQRKVNAEGEQRSKLLEALVEKNP